MGSSGLGKVPLAMCFENDNNSPDFVKSVWFLQYLLAYKHNKRVSFTSLVIIIQIAIVCLFVTLFANSTGRFAGPSGRAFQGVGIRPLAC